MKFVPITEVCDFQGGTQPPKEEWENQPKQGYVRMLQIRDFTQKKIEHVEYVKISGKIKTCDADDILIGRYGASIGKILTGLSGAYNVAIVKTIPDQNQITKPFLYYVLKNAKFQSFIGNIGGRAAQAGFNKEDLSTFQIPLPPLPEQIHIANVLSKAEALLAKRKESLALLDAYLKSTFLEMFGDPVRNEKGWDVESLNSILVKIESGWSPVCEDSPRKNLSEWGILKLSAVTYDFFNPNENKKLKPDTIIKKKIEVKKNDLLFARKNTIELVGSCAYIFEDFPKLLLSDLIFKLKYDNSKVNGIFLWKLLCDLRKSKQFHKIASGTAGSMPNISQERLMGFKIILPPLELQNQFAAVVEKVEALKERYQESLRELEALYGSLSQRAFRGELELGLTDAKENFKNEKGPEEADQEYKKDKIEEDKYTLNISKLSEEEFYKFNTDDLIILLKKYSGKSLSFEEIWKEILNLKNRIKPSREDIQNLIIKILEDSNPCIEQTYDEPCNADKFINQTKQILFRVLI